MKKSKYVTLYDLSIDNEDDLTIKIVPKGREVLMMVMNAATILSRAGIATTTRGGRKNHERIES